MSTGRFGFRTISLWAAPLGLTLGLGLACAGDDSDGNSEDADCQAGTEYCECLGGSVCEGDLVCTEGYCVAAGNGETGDGDGDPTTGDGDGDPTTGDGDGDPTTGDGDGDPTTGDGDGDPTTGDGDGDPTTGDGDGDPTTGDGDGDPVDPFDCPNLEFPVNVVGGGGYGTIAAAVAAAPPNATIQVCPGTYFENITITRNLTLIGAGQDLTILHGSGNATVIYVDGVDLDLSGVTVTHGLANHNILGGAYNCGGGLAAEYIDGQEINISDSIFAENSGTLGAGLCFDGTGSNADADVTLTNVQVHDNEGTQGAGIYSYSDLALIDTVLVNNIAIAKGGGMYLSYATVSVTGGQVRENAAGSEGGGAYIQSPTLLTVTSSDWGEGQALENGPDDVGCNAGSFGWFGADASFTCTVPNSMQCTCN